MELPSWWLFVLTQIVFAGASILFFARLLDQWRIRSLERQVERLEARLEERTARLERRLWEREAARRAG